MKHNMFLFTNHRRFLKADDVDGYSNSSVKNIPKAPITIKESLVTQDTLTWPDGVEKNISVDNEALKVKTEGWKEEYWGNTKVHVSPEIEVDRAVYDGDGNLVLQPGDILPEGDITEFVDDEFAWEQLFSWKAALYVAAIAGKRVPKDEEYDHILENEDTLARELLKTTPVTGRRNSTGNFYNKGEYTYLWSSTENDTSSAWRRDIYYNSAIVYRYDNDKSLGFAVRLIQDL